MKIKKLENLIRLQDSEINCLSKQNENLVKEIENTKSSNDSLKIHNSNIITFLKEVYLDEKL